MLQPFQGNFLAMMNDPMMSQRSGRAVAVPSQKQAASKLRAMSNHRDMNMIAPRMSNAVGFIDDMAGFHNPMALISNIQNQLVGHMFGMIGFGDGHSMAGFQEQPRRAPQNSMQGRGMAGKMVCQTYVMSTKMGPDGRPYKEQYFSNKVSARDADGTTLSEKQQAYRNSGNGMQKIFLEKTMNNQGRKMVKERIKGGNEERTHNYFLNLDENQGDDFEQKWMKKGQEMGFLKDFGNALGYDNYQQHRPISARTPQSKPKPTRTAPARNSRNESNADAMGLGWSQPQRTARNESNAQSMGLAWDDTPVGTPSNRVYTNEDYVPPPNVRVVRAVKPRANDLMPATTGRVVGGTASLNDLDNHRTREAPTRNSIQPHHHHHHHTEETHHTPTNRNLASQIRAHNPTNAAATTKIDNQGNFRNKNPQNVMPQAG